MPIVLGAFETSLRGGDSPQVDRRVLHKGCCGSLHGAGVKKERASRDVPKGSKTCFLQHSISFDMDSSSDESSSILGQKQILQQPRRSQSSDTPSTSPRLQTQLSNTSNGSQRRSASSNATLVAQRLFTSPTKSTTAKLRAERTASDGKRMSNEMAKLSGSQSASNIPKKVAGAKNDPSADHDSGHFSSDAEQPTPPSLVVHHATSEDELSMEELRRRQRKERRDYVQRHSPIKGHHGGAVYHRKESPSPAGPRFSGERGRRSSDESDSSSLTPPPTPSARSTSSRPWGPGLGLASTLSGRRAKSSGNTSGKKLAVNTCPYAFGSSQKRFFDDGSPTSGVGVPATPSSPEGSLYSGSDLRRSNSNNGGRIPPSPTSTLPRKPAPLNKSSSDGVQNSFGSKDPALNRSSSDSRVSSNRRSPTDAAKDSWLKIKDDLDNALQKKPNQSGFYKNLSDMMHNKMAMLNQAKTEEQVASEQAFLDAERVWLVHKEGFAAAGQLRDEENPPPEGKVRVQLDYNGDIIEVDEDDVEKANPPTFDTVEDLAQLRYLNESSVLHTLRQRYGNNLIHTYAGPTIITINPMSPLSIYSEKVIQMFKDCKLEDMPPHIYSVANDSYRTMIRTRKDQSIIMIGRSGSGKTTNTKHVLSCLAHTAALSRPATKRAPASPLTSEKVNAVFCLLEAFGNSRTVMNANATRFTQLISVDFDTSGQIVSTSIQALMLEKSRVVRRPEGEPNFNVFYQMIAGLDPKTRRDLNLESLNDPNLFMTPLQRVEDKAKAAAAWTRIQNAAKTLGVTSQESSGIWSVLAAIYHLGVASVSRGNMGKTQFARPQAAQRAAQCLGTTVEELARSIFQGNTSTTTLNRKLRSSDRDSANLPDGIESLEGFVVNLYQEVFNAVVYLINRSISTTSNHVSNSILLLDTPGFQNPATCGRLAGATFEELCHNYVQERLQLMFHDRTITSLHEKYLQEQIDCDMGDIEDLPTPAPLISLIDKQAGIRYSQSDLSSADRRGLLWLLDEEAIFPGATDESFVERLLLQYNQRGNQELVKKGPGEKQFLLHHYQGTNPVLYNAEGWLAASREDSSMKAAAFLLQESSHKHISDLFYQSRGPVSVSVSGSVAGMEGSHALRRASSIRRTFTSSGHAGIKRNSVALQVKFQVDGLCEQLRRSKIHFVHCFLPQHNAGLCDVKGGAVVARKKSSDDIVMNVPLVRSQLRGAQILDAVRLHKNGFPESSTFADFWRRYRILADTEELQKLEPGVTEFRSAVEKLLQTLDLDQSAIRLGNTQVFLRSGLLAHLDEEREERLIDQVVQLQALCRGYLARKHAQKLKVQDIAIRCIQKNVRKFIGVREWPWWRLLIKLTPMLNVHRTEDQLKARTDELDTLRARFEKMEKERAELKITNERLESKLSEMTADLAEEHSTATLATERLEAEQSERMRLEKEKADLESRNKHLQSNSERMEMELLYSRALDMNGGVDYSDEDGENSIYKQKYERAMKELEFAKRRLQQQHEDDMEQLIGLKKQLEKKLNDAYEEVDEQRQVVAQWKRKTQKLQGEMHDLKLLLEEQTSRNVLLEKKQRKFDADLGLLNEERKAETLAREKLQKEIDSLKSVKYQLEEQVQALKLDLDFKDEKISSLTKEMDDLHTGGATEEEVANLKRQKHELEMRLKEEEEEIDDLAGQVQLLEQSKVKLEMSIAAMKKEHRREMANKEEELEDARAANQKKVKSLEQQLENEHEERLNFVREKHELETKILNLQELAARSADEEQVSKLKKDLKRTKALLKDAQLMIERSKSDSSNKVVMRQLKNQLEDSEFARTAAIKAKQNLELELSDVQQQLDDVLRSKSDLEDRLLRMSREKADLSTQLEDSEEELQEVMRKYKASVAQLSVDQITIQEQSNRIADLEDERNRMKEQIAELTQRIESLEGDTIVNTHQNRLEMKIKELESKLELEQTTRGRMETQINRLKEGIEKVNSECDSLRNKELASQEAARKLQRQLRDLREDYAGLQQKETEVNSKKNELEKQLELSEAETVLAKNDLKLAMKRIEDLQTAINVELDSESDSANSDSDSSEEGMESFLDHHRRAVSVQRERESVAREAEARASIQREVRASIARESVARTLHTMHEEPELKLSEGSTLLEETESSFQSETDAAESTA